MKKLMRPLLSYAFAAVSGLCLATGMAVLAAAR